MSTQSRPSILVLFTFSYLFVLHQAQTNVFLCLLRITNSFPPQGLCILPPVFAEQVCMYCLFRSQPKCQLFRGGLSGKWSLASSIPVILSYLILFSSQSEMISLFKLNHLTPALRKLTVTKRSPCAFFSAISLKYRVANKSRNTGKYMVRVILHVIHDKIILNMFPGCI